jgi:O-antigen ligase
MSAFVRAAFVVAVVAIATLGEGGASATSLVVQHLVLAIAVAAGAVLLEPADHAPSRAPAIAWLAFAGLAALGAFVAPYAYAAWLVLVEILAFGVLAWIASAGAVVLARVLPPAIALLATGHGLAAVVQKLRGDARPASSFLNPNHLAAWLAAAALLLAGRAIGRSAPVRERWMYGVAILSALAGISVTGSRGAVLGLAAGAGVLAAAALGELSERARRGLLAAAALAALAMGLGIALRFRSENDPYQFHRTKIWSASLRAALDSPFLGTGPGQFAVAARNLNFPLEDAPLRYERAFRTPHSDVLRALCEFGFPAGLAALAAVALAGGSVLQRRHGLTDVERGAMAALCGLAVQACVDDLSTRPAITMAGAALAGLLLARPIEPPARASRRAAVAAAAALTVLALGVGEVAGFVAWSESHDLPRGRLDPGQLDRLRRSIAWNPMQPDGWERLAEHFVGDGRSFSLSDYAAAREAAEAARRLQPKDATYARADARVEAIGCLTLLPFEATRERAARLYDDALGLARTDATIPLEAARFLLQAGDPAGARRAAESALKIEPRAAAPRLVLAQAILRQEGAAGGGRARRLVDEALALAPRADEKPSSAYDAALRSVDPRLVEAIRGDLDAR